MTLPMDPELLTLMQPLMAAAAALESPAIGDVATRRERATPFFQALGEMRGAVSGVEMTHHCATASEGTELDLAWYFPTSEPSGGAGGGLAAGVSLLARDRGGPALTAQLLIYPMLDDRTTSPDPQLAPELLTWTYDDNITGWGALLGDDAGSDDVSVYAAPARAQDLAGLPPTYIDVGDLDIFRDEDIAYAARLSAAGVPTELHVHPGCPHAFESLAPTAAVSTRVVADRIRRLRSI